MQGLRKEAQLRLPLATLAAAGSGVALWLALPPVDLGPLALVALTPLLLALRGVRARRGALLGLVFGLAFNGLLFTWLIPVSLVAYGGLVLGVSAFLTLFGAVVPLIWNEQAPIRTAVAIGAAWALVEWFRGIWPFGGWHWTWLGATQHDNPLLIPLLSTLGSLGLGAVLATINALILMAALRVPRWGRAAYPLAIAAGLAVAPVVIPLPHPAGPKVDVAIVQGNVPLEIGTASRIIEDTIVAENHALLHRELQGDPPDLVVWPENALDRDPTRDPELGPVIEDAIRQVGAPTLVGAITETGDGRLLNEDLLYTAGGQVVDRYAKNHPLPFGEFVPFRDALDWIPDISRVRADLSPGTQPGRFSIGDMSFAAIICFENAFPDIVRDFVTEEQGFLVVSTNNSTFGISAAPEQHILLSQLRAMESGRWVVHAALSGISAFISPEGEVLQATELFRPAVLRSNIPTASGTTVYDAIGGWLPLLFLVLLGIAYLTPRRSKPRAVAPLGDDARVAVILPTYDERDTIEEVIERVLASSDRVRVMVVDDSSPDGTGEIVRKLVDKDPRVSLVERPEKGGLASAYLDGFVLAIAEGYDLIVEMDADLSHNPEELRRLLDGARTNHVTIGSRYVPGGRVRNWSLFRRTLSRGGNLYVRLMLGIPITDSTSGFRAYRWQALRQLITHQLRSEGYGFQIELAYRAWRRGMVVGEVPITFEERRHGQSKISRSIVLEALWHVLVWAIRDRLLRRRPPSRHRHPTALPATD